jgi:hypothetical protein
MSFTMALGDLFINSRNALSLQNTHNLERYAYAATYQSLMTQISQLASDSGYRGMNFLTAGSQTVEFGQRTNEEGANSLMLQTRQNQGSHH